MITLMELKRILFKAPVLVMFCFILPLYVLAGFIAGVTAPAAPAADLGSSAPSSVSQAVDAFQTDTSSTYYNAKITQKLDNLLEEIEFHSPDFDYTADLLTSFKVFRGSEDAQGGYLGSFFYMTQSTTQPVEIAPYFAQANDFFWRFSALADEYVIDLERVKMNGDDRASFLHALEKLKDCFNYAATETFEDSRYTFTFFRDKRIEITGIWDNDYGREIPAILERAENLSLTAEQQTELLDIYNEEIDSARDDAFIAVCESESIADFQVQLARFTDITDISVKYLNARQKRMQDSFNLLTDPASLNDNNIATFKFLLSNSQSRFDYSSPFVFKQVMHAPTGTSVFDFVFNCFEIISVPLIVFAVVAAVFCIFDDINKGTVYTTLVSPQGRKRIIGAKLLAIMWTVTLVVLIFFILFYMTAVIMLGGAAPPAVLTVFGGKVITVAPVVLLFLYLLSLLFKILFFAAWAALISVTAKSAVSIFVRIFICAAFMLAANLFLSAFSFYQFIPLLALEFIQYWGVKPMMLWQAAPHYSWLITVPVMMFIWAVFIVWTVRRFNARDF